MVVREAYNMSVPYDCIGVECMSEYEKIER